MLVAAISFVLLLQAQTSLPPQASASTAAASSKSNVTPEQLEKKLLTVRRIFVDSFGDDSISKQLQAMMVQSLLTSKRFIVTEDKEKADATLKGSALEKSFQEVHSSTEGTAAAGRPGSAAAVYDSSTSTETIDDARAAVRLVDSDGDVIWASAQESRGAKYRGSSSDVADKIVKQLLRDIDKLEKKSNQPGSSQATEH